MTYGAGAIFAVDATGALNVLDAATGEPYWDGSVALGNWRIHQQVAIGHGMVFVGPVDSSNIPTGDKAVLALDLATGAERWRHPIHAGQLSDPLVSGDSVYVATADGYGMALNALDGRVRWREPIHGAYLSAAAADGGVVVFGGDGGVVTARSTLDGHLLWQFQAEDHSIWQASFPYSPVISDGVVYVTCWNRRCYALDSENGEQLWASEMTEKRPPLTAPLVGDESVIFCGHDRYVYCLDRTTGQRRWTQQFARPSNNTPFLIAGRLYVVPQDGKLHALDPATGKPDAKTFFETKGKVDTAWATDGQSIFLGDRNGGVYAIAAQRIDAVSDPAEFEQRGQWTEAAALHALNGDLLRAGEIYCVELGEPSKAAQLYERGGQLAPAAEQYRAVGELEAARRLYQKLDQPDMVAKLSEELQEPLAAAQAYEEARQWAEAGRLYAMLQQWPQAAGNFERAGDSASKAGNAAEAKALWEQAGDAYRRVEQPEKAAQLFQQAGADQKARAVAESVQGTRVEFVVLRTVYGSEYVARLLASRKRYIEAAREYESAGLLTAAGEMYEQAGEYALAAERYQQAGNTEAAAHAMTREGNWSAAGEMFIAAGQPQQAANAFAKAENHLRAAELYHSLENWAAAAMQQEAMQDWEQAAHAWMLAEDWARAANDWERAGDLWELAECACKAAEAQEQQGNTDDASVHYDQAMHAYSRCGADQRARYCDLRRRFLRKQPLLEVSLAAARELVVGESNKVEITVKNIGWGHATNISVEVTPRFEDDPVAVRSKVFGLRTDLSKAQDLYVVPHHPGQLALDIAITYSDLRGQADPHFERTVDVAVRDKDASHDMTP
ncbi:MAG: PQQ-binding-like beta-propeller repeat protein, partial [Anaerolineae bacterium]|nr:PQQ-binding-like beta-propeller repeat protein [Anaerolineae bacterium]